MVLRGRIRMVLLFADVMSIGEAAAGGVDLHALEAGLRAHAHRPLRVGAFSAASNVTGILSDVDAITASLHAHGVPSPSGSTRWRRPLCRRLAEDGDARRAISGAPTPSEAADGADGARDARSTTPSSRSSS